MDDMISRQAAIEAIKTWGLIDGLAEGQAIEILSDEEKLPSVQPEVLACGEGELSAQPEIKPISYEDCANAMLKMWMDNVLTDGEYNRIMDKLNAHWRMKNERSDKQASGD